MLNNIFKPKPEAPLTLTPISVLLAAPINVSQPFMALGPGQSEAVCIHTMVRDVADLLADVQQFKPQIVLLSPETRGYSPTLVTQLTQWSDFPIAVVGLVPPTGNWGAEMANSGALTFYTTPVTSSIVEQFVQEAPHLAAQAREHWSAPLIASGVSRQVVESAGATPYRTGVITFWSAKGGDGKTTLAVNSACLLSQIAGKRVLLVDADMNCGRTALHLDIAPGQNTLIHLASDYKANQNQLTGKMLKHRLAAADRQRDTRTGATESRLDVLFGITRIQQASAPELFGQQGQQFMTDLLRLGRELYDFVIVDSGSSTQMGPHFGALLAADSVMLICTSDRTSLYHNRETLEALIKQADMRADKFKLVMNRYDPADRVDLKDAANFMRLPIFATVPEDRSRSVIAAVNQGQPFVLQHMGRNSAEVEATLRGMLDISEEIYPPMGRLIAERARQQAKRPRFQWTLGRSRP